MKVINCLLDHIQMIIIESQRVINLTSITGSYLFSFPLWLWSRRLVLIVVLHHMITFAIRLNFSVWNSRVPCIIIMAVPVIGQNVHLFTM